MIHPNINLFGAAIISVSEAVWNCIPKPIQSIITFTNEETFELKVAITESFKQKDTKIMSEYCEKKQKEISGTISSIWSGFTRIIADAFPTGRTSYL